MLRVIYPPNLPVFSLALSRLYNFSNPPPPYAPRATVSLTYGLYFWTPPARTLYIYTHSFSPTLSNITSRPYVLVQALPIFLSLTISLSLSHPFFFLRVWGIFTLVHFVTETILVSLGRLLHNSSARPHHLILLFFLNWSCNDFLELSSYNYF